MNKKRFDNTLDFWKSIFCSFIIFCVLFVILAPSKVEKATQKKIQKVYSIEKKQSQSSENSVRKGGGGEVSLDIPVKATNLSFGADGILAASIKDILPSGELFGGLSGQAGFESSLSAGGFGDEGIEIFNIDVLDKIPRRKNDVRINYPESMLSKGIEGVVKLLVVIDVDGSVSIDSTEFATNQIFEEAAKKAIENLKYETPTKGGKAVRAKFILPIPFKIVK